MCGGDTAENQECEESADSAAADSADSVADSVLEYIFTLELSQ